MANAEKPFELEFQNCKIQVQQHSIGYYRVFRISFPDQRQPLNVTRAVHAEAFGFWTSIPEGRQKEAEEIGALISKYLVLHEGDNKPDDVLL